MRKYKKDIEQTLIKDLLPYIVNKLEIAKIKHEVHNFDSGAKMIDIFIENKLYVIQIYDDELGLSLNTEETTWFDIIPEKLYKDTNEFKIDFEKLFIPI